LLATRAQASRTSARCIGIEMTLIFPQEVQQPLVVVRHVEKFRDAFVIAVREIQRVPCNRPHIVTRQIAQHERLVDDGPETFASSYHPLEQYFRGRAAV
jgi:hypothetical protein